jgi:competence protein ComEA
VPTCYTPVRSLARVFEDVDKGRLVAYAAVLLLVIAVALRLHAHGSGGGASVSLEEPARAAPASGAAPAAGGAASPAGRELYVDVAGAVRRPGLYRLPAGSRVAAAVERAGGLSRRADRTGVNLAAQLADGQQVIVPGRGTVGAGGAAASGASGPAGAGARGGGTISLSTASEAQLETIDGIGPALAGRIIEYRDSHGGFHSLDELKQVSGIGDKRFETLQKALRP